jgi:S1-C subfamily serine protease
MSWRESGTPNEPHHPSRLREVSSLRPGLEAPTKSRTRGSRGTMLIAAGLVLLFVGTVTTDAWFVQRMARTTRDVDALTRSIASLRAAQSRDSTQLDALVTQVTGDESHSLDASKIAAIAKPAVFTVVAGPFLGTAFGFYHDGSDTYLVTNYHVVQTATLTPGRVVSVHQDKNTWSGEVSKWNSHFDLALIRVAADLPVLQSASAQSHEPTVGEPVMAYGSPYGLEDTATVGIISAFRKQFIQTDAPINHGNSGGPLLDPYGDVVGVTSYGVGAGGSGLGLAIDVGEVCQVLLTADIC